MPAGVRFRPFARPYFVFNDAELHNGICPFVGIQLVFNVMPAAFAELEIPPVYAMLFFLSLFICGFMFLVSVAYIVYKVFINKKIIKYKFLGFIKKFPWYYFNLMLPSIGP